MEGQSSLCPGHGSPWVYRERKEPKFYYEKRNWASETLCDLAKFKSYQAMKWNWKGALGVPLTRGGGGGKVVGDCLFSDVACSP